MVKLAVVAFAATVTLAGTVAADVLLFERVTTAPPVGAGPLRVTVPVEDVPPITDRGLRPTLEHPQTTSNPGFGSTHTFPTIAG